MLFLSLLAFSAPIFALPAASPDAAPASTNITLYTGTTNSGVNVSCGYNIGQATYQAHVCNNILTQGLGVPLSKTSSKCTFTLYSGSTTCDPSNNLGVTVYHLPKGTGEQCIQTGVEDGGNHYHGSGIWAC